MRVVVGARDTRRRWLPPKINETEGELVCDALRRFVVLSAENIHYEHFMQEVQHVEAPPQMRGRIGYLLSRLPLAQRGSKPPVDIYAEDCSDSQSPKLLSTLTSPTYRSLKESRARSIPRGKNRDVLFEEFLLPYAGASTTVKCFDQYMFNNLETPGRARGLIWFLQKLIDAGVEKLDLYSATPPSGHVDGCAEELEKHLSKPIHIKQRGTTIEVTLVDAAIKVWGKPGRPDDEHDRHVRFLIGNDRRRASPVFDLGPGMDLFNFEETRKSLNLVEAHDAVAAVERELRIENAAQYEPLTFEVQK